MTFEEVLQAIEQLSREEQQRLRHYLDQTVLAPFWSPEERIRQIDAAVALIREDMTQAELDEMTAAMNEEYIEPWNESEWTE